MGSPNDSVNLPVLILNLQQIGCNSKEQPWFPSWSHHSRFTFNVTFFQIFALGTPFQAVLLKFWNSFCRATEDQTLVYFHKPELLYSSLSLQVILLPTEMWDLLSKCVTFIVSLHFFLWHLFPTQFLSQASIYTWLSVSAPRPGTVRTRNRAFLPITFIPNLNTMPSTNLGQKS